MASSSTPNNAKFKGKVSKKVYEPDNQDSFIYDRESEIKEIDARLKSLQMFMKNNMP
jgi:hypothetical protein